jgi:succinate-acetate transporter protein
MSTDVAAAAATTIHGPVPAEGGPLTGDPTSLGLPGFIAGSTAFGLAQAGVVPPAAAGAALPVILGFSAAVIFLTTIWAAALGRNAVTIVFGIFAAFWLCDGLLLLGLAHNWFGIAPASVTATRELYLVVWLVVIVTLTLATLRLPLIYTAVFALVDLALLLSLLGLTQGSPRARPGCRRQAATPSWRSPPSASTCSPPPPRWPPAAARCRSGVPSCTDPPRHSERERQPQSPRQAS